ncbi:MAG: serine/threonine-protein kinase [Verrucomicrobia bacterium]|nr:serine/threonine-protein kinase [Verrucomicrobiota bacterium]
MNAKAMNESGSIAETIFMGARQLPRRRSARPISMKKCSHDPALRERVERLLQAEQKADRFLANNPLELDGSPPVRNELTGKEGSILGKYKLLQQIGEGGCGVVYMAEQEQPMRRRVALKLIKPGMDTRQVIARFEAERQALAMMDHPNIARVLDAGATETGHPYFVMELVRGIRITEYCDQNNLSTRDRLELFTQVAQAVQHAHQKGIIHRDLKPSNVLVTLHDGVPVPKVIDFGIAKAIAQKLTDKTLFTQFGQFIGTPAYTSPEQAEMSGPDIDTRSDIYSLGVLLYELMVGRTPFDTKELLQSGLEEMRRIIREKEPNRPSTLLSTMLAEERTSTAQRRAASPPELIHVLRGDLDWIVMKCLEKDRTRRYETASGLAADIQHYLSNEPVVARPPSTAYRFNKLVRRNKLAFTAGAAVAVALVAGIIASTWQAARARRAERAAQEERDSAEAVLMFFRDKVLAAGRPEGQQGGLGKDVTLRQAIDTAEAEISRSFTNRPLVEAAIRMTIGESYRYLGELGLASEQLEQAFALYRDTLGLDHGVTVSALDALQQAYKDSGTPSRSLLLYEELFKSRKAKLGLEHDDTLTAMNNLGLAHMYLGHHDQARPLLEETLRIRKAKLEPGHVSTLATMHNLAALYWALGQTAPGLALYEETLELKRAKLGSDHDDTQLTMRNLVGVYLRAGKSEQAVALAEELYALAKSKRGPEHPDTLRNHSELSYTYSRVGMPEQAVSHYEELLRIRKARLGPEHPDTLTSMNNLGLAYSEAGKSDQAVPLLEETLRLRRIKLGREHPGTLSTLNNLALAYEDLGKLDRAVVLLEEALELYRANLGSEHHETLNTMNNLAVIYGKAGKPDQGVGAGSGSSGPHEGEVGTRASRYPQEDE